MKRPAFTISGLLIVLMICFSYSDDEPEITGLTEAEAAEEVYSIFLEM